MISILATDKTFEEISRFNSKEELNRRGFWNINRIQVSSISEVFKSVEEKLSDSIENLVVDIDIYEDKLQSLELIKKFRRLSGFDLYVIAINYSRKDLVLKRLLEVGVDANNIFTGSIDSICKLLNSNIYKDTEKVEQPQSSDTLPEKKHIDESINEMILSMENNLKKIFKPENNKPLNRIPSSKPEEIVDNISLNTPPDNIPIKKTEFPETTFSPANEEPSHNNESYNLAKESHLEKENNAINTLDEKVTSFPFEPPISSPNQRKNTAITIGVIGAGRRVGTTTQSLQLILYLKKLGYTAALVEMNKTSHMSTYLYFQSEHVQQKSIIDKNHFVIHDIDIYRSARAMLEAKSSFSYVICDYGDCSNNDITSFLERDIKVVVGCVKPYEVEALKPFFSIDNNDINYIFSFVDESLQKDIIVEMDTAGSRTFFAKYTPNLFRCSDNDSIYKTIINAAPELLINNLSSTKNPLGLSKKFKISRCS